MDGAFQRPMKEGLIATIVIEDADPDSVEALLAYVIGYTQACPTTAPTGSLQKFSAGLFQKSLVPAPQSIVSTCKLMH